jgi:hypothetical protein
MTMPFNSEEMQRFAEGLEFSQSARSAWLSDLFGFVGQMQETFRDEMRARAATTAEKLRAFREEFRAACDAGREERRAFLVGDVRSELMSMRRRFASEREAMRTEVQGAQSAWNEHVRRRFRFTQPGGPAPPFEAGPEADTFAEGLDHAILSVLRTTPGLRLQEIAERLGEPWQRLTFPAGALVRAGKARRTKGCYFPTEEASNEDEESF